MRKQTRRQQANDVQRAVESLVSEEATSVTDMASHATRSRFHFQRVFKDVMGETPGELRRRMLLERAAWQLQNSPSSATEIAFEAEFGTLEGFIRAFQRAFGISPTRYRKVGSDFRLPSRNGVHFSPTAGVLPLQIMPRGETMDLADRLLDHDLWLTRQMLEQAKGLSEEQLDAPLASASHAVGFEPEQKSLRDLLDRIVFTKEVWVAALENQGMPPRERDLSIKGLISRLEIAYPTFISLLKRIRDQGKWDEEFIDAVCEPPETFTFGGMAAHVLTFGIFRRQLALDLMRGMGIEALGYGDPIGWERGLG